MSDLSAVRELSWGSTSASRTTVFMRSSNLPPCKSKVEHPGQPPADHGLISPGLLESSDASRTLLPGDLTPDAGTMGPGRFTTRVGLIGLTARPPAGRAPAAALRRGGSGADAVVRG